MSTEFIILMLDLVGVFVFALSGAQAARESELDLFGIFIIAFLTACGGGLIRDIFLGITPPAAIQNWEYILTTTIAVVCVLKLKIWIEKIKFPIMMFDALGLSVFSIAGTQKALFLGFNYQVAILIGVFSAIGGGIFRDVLLGKIPVVFRKEIYASAALLGAVIFALSFYLNIHWSIGTWIGISASFLLRYLSIRNKWNLPTYSK